MKRVKNILLITYLLILTLILIVTFYFKFCFSNETIEELYFYLTNGVVHADAGVFLIAVGDCLLFFLLVFGVLLALYYNILIDKEVYLNIKFKNGKSIRKQIYPLNFFLKHRKVSLVITTIFILFLSIINMNGINYIKDNVNVSTFIEDNYVMPKNNNIVFEKKKNLILIFAESFETTLFSKEEGGEWDYNVMPEMYDLLNEEDSIYFASDNKIGGVNDLFATTWTTASIVANTSGLPFKIPIDGNKYHSDDFMNGAYTLGDILKDNEYYNEVISAANMSFGGLKEYYTKHGNYNIIDGDNVKKYDKNYNKSNKSSWGMNDKYLFDIAKKRLENISKTNKPFNLNLITIDTHGNDEYLGAYSERKYKSSNENAYATSSKLIYEFIEYVKKQPYYKDTTIVILGDHPSMHKTIYKNIDKSRRLRYNVIINSLRTSNNTKNRTFTALDMYPTILSSIGANIENDRLSLGTNLFSNKKTLAEQYGLSKLDSEMSKRSMFYNEEILGNDYTKLLLRNKDRH